MTAIGKNIVLFLDGTGNEYGDQNTNVVLLHDMAIKGEHQAVHYDPGVGTFSVSETLTGFGNFWQKALGLAFGFGMRETVTDAYAFVMKHYREGDRILIFGFSRGAYAARLLAALLHGIGILADGGENLIEYGLRYLQMGEGNLDFRRLRGFSKQFRRCKAPRDIFLGLWDTVSSVSWAFDRQVYAYTTKNSSVSQVRHAVAIDEKRAFFTPNLYQGSGAQEGRDYKEVWFAGVHSDVGGGYSSAQPLLSIVTLEWMLVEARSCGLLVDEKRAWKLLINKSKSTQKLAPPLTKRHKSLQGPWWACEVWPKRMWFHRQKKWGWRWNCGRKRTIETGAIIHESVELRQSHSSYGPANLPTNLAIEDRVPFEYKDKTNSVRKMPAWSFSNQKSSTELVEETTALSKMVAFVAVCFVAALYLVPIYLLWRLT